MGSGRAATRPIPKISSETNLAVQLLLAVRDGTSCPNRPPVTHSATSSDVRADTSEDSDSTDCAAPSVASPPVQQKHSLPSTSSPRISPPLSRNDATLFKYTREERQEALQRFREKKRRRQFRKRVRYMVRKRLAETRPRYKGRFSKPPPGENYDDGTPGPPAQKNSSPTPTAEQPVRKEAAAEE